MTTNRVAVFITSLYLKKMAPTSKHGSTRFRQFSTSKDYSRQEQCSEPIMVTGTDESANKQYITHVEKTENWDYHNKETKAQITLTLSDKPLNGVIHARSAGNAWNKLNYCYER